jgi:7,8-dihydropterin-6-yl-methyl-4-(beta-D-ribofuranosyl)aminobenzene 5'-phosphate synthase
MLTDLKGIGEWGYSALVEADGETFLFDTGARPETVLRNAEELGIDLSRVTDVVFSHNHTDHTGGLLHLREVLAKKNPNALGQLHVGKGIFLHRVSSAGRV